MRIAIIFAAVLFLSLLTPAVFAHYPHTSNECATTEQLGSREKCLLEQRESAKEVKFMDVFFSEGSKDLGGNANGIEQIPNEIEVEPGDGTTRLVAVMANSGSLPNL